MLLRPAQAERPAPKVFQSVEDGEDEIPDSSGDEDDGAEPRDANLAPARTLAAELSQLVQQKKRQPVTALRDRVEVFHLFLCFGLCRTMIVQLQLEHRKGARVTSTG